VTGSKNDFALEMYRRMFLIRTFEEEVTVIQGQGHIAGSLHTSIGQEGEIVGACMALTREDYMVGNHRSHGHPIAKGAAIPPLVAELLGRSDGVCRGKGGSMHLSDFSVGSLGETSIVGSGLPVAVGAALGSKLQGNQRVTLCFFGDGAANEGTFHESLNLASIWRLPVIFLCENNGYAVSTPINSVTAVANIADRAAAYSMPGHVVDGQDVEAVYAVASEAVSRARAGEGPTLIEAKTFRYDGHALHVRPVEAHQAELADWKARDPVKLYRARLLEMDVTESELAQIEAAVVEEIKSAVKFGFASPLPTMDDTYEDVFIQPVPRTPVNL
jgi:TPP-dependent pyruvate/acetoin dehydrogenase alpha subunit